ncbi:hypothetical protein ACWATR_18420 [Nostoc sp. UIC 10890]
MRVNKTNLRDSAIAVKEVDYCCDRSFNSVLLTCDTQSYHVRVMTYD